MTIINLIQRHPLLYADLKSMGLPTTTMQEVAHLLSAQLGGQPEGNLCEVLSSLDSRGFLNRTDVAEIAEQTGLAPSIVQCVVLTLAPWVDRFRMTQRLR